MKSFALAHQGEQNLKNNVLLLILIKSRQIQVSFLLEKKFGFNFFCLGIHVQRRRLPGVEFSWSSSPAF